MFSGGQRSIPKFAHVTKNSTAVSTAFSPNTQLPALQSSILVHMKHKPRFHTSTSAQDEDTSSNTLSGPLQFLATCSPTTPCNQPLQKTDPSPKPPLILQPTSPTFKPRRGKDRRAFPDDERRKSLDAQVAPFGSFRFRFQGWGCCVPTMT